MLNRKLCVFLLTAFMLYSSLSFARTVTFSAGPQLELGHVGAIGWTIATGDLNSDGNLDVVAVRPDSDQVVVWFGKGDGTFQSEITLRTTSDPTVVAVGDINGDGNPDIVVPDLQGTMAVLFGDGKGAFNDPITYQIGGLVTQPIGPTAIQLADLNGDGLTDIVIGHSYGSYGNQGGNTIAIKLGRGNGTFDETTFLSGGYDIASLQVVDVNGDGIPDLVAGNRDSATSRTGGATIVLGNGDGTFRSGASYATGNFVWNAAAADLNGDSIPDLVVSNSESDTISLLYGNGDGTFQAPVNRPVSVGPTGVKIVDFDQDGKNDILITACYDGVPCDLNILWNVGESSFRTQTGLITTGRGNAFFSAVGDFNNDGALDIGSVMFTGNLDFSLLLFLNTGGTQVVLSSSPNPSVLTDPVTLTASITATLSGMAPTGTVVFSSDEDVIDTAPLESEVATLTVSSLKAGSHKIVARYSGDEQHVPVTYAAISQQVNRIATVTVLSGSSASATYGSTVTLGIRVSPERTGNPTGSAIVYQDGSSIGSVVLDASGEAALTVTLRAVGNTTFNVKYDGDSDFAPSSSENLSVNVVKASSSVTLESSENPSALGAPVKFTITVHGENVVPSGHVVLRDGTTEVANAILDSAGQQKITLSSLHSGTRQLSVIYSGDEGHLDSTSSVLQQNIADFDVSSSGATSQVRAGQSASFILSISGTGQFSGSVDLSCSGALPLGSCQVSPTSLSVNQDPAAATVTVRTTGPNTTTVANIWTPWTLSAFAFVVPLSFVGTAHKRFGWKRIRGCLGLLVLLGLGACGGGGSTGGNTPPRVTPAGEYTVNVTATATFAGTTISHSAPLKVTVTQ